MNGGKQAMPLLGFSSPGATALHARNVRSRKRPQRRARAQTHTQTYRPVPEYSSV